MLQHLWFALELAGAALLCALLEINIEGPHGWAEKLPTWRVSNRWTRLFYSGRPLTGYHLYLQLLILVLLHYPFALGLVQPAPAAEMRILAFMILFWVLEDFLWFVLNPAFGIRGFRRERIWWHAPSWWWIMPRDYWLFAPLGVLLYVCSWG